MNRVSVVIGVAAAAALAALYAVVVGAVGGSVHLVRQSAADWPWLVLILAGFGTQVAAYAELRRRRRLTAAVFALAFAVTVWIVLSRGTGTDQSDLGSRTATVGAVDVHMTAVSLGADGARFRVEFDTHTVDLDVDLPAAAELRVNGQPSGETGLWEGDGPGGHHRAGTLRFDTEVPPGATVELRITGLPRDAVGTWAAP